MARYTTVAKVRGLCRLVTSEVFDDATVEAAIDDATTRIDARLRRVYAPLTEPHLFYDAEAATVTHPFIELIARNLAAAECLETWYSNRQSAVEDGDEQPRYRTYRAKAERDIKDLLGEGTGARLVLEGYGATASTSETASAAATSILTNREPVTTTDSGFATGSLRDEVSLWGAL